MKTIKKDRLKILLCGGIQRAAAKLHMGPSTLATMSLEIRDENGNLEKRIEQKSNSFVRNYYNWLSIFAIMKAPCNSTDTAFGTFGDGIDTPLKDTTGVLKGAYSIQGSEGAVGFPTNNRSLTAGIANASGVATSGIIVGASDFAESLDSYTMGSLISHGITAGQLSYGPQAAVATFAFDIATKKLTATHSRSFSNSSGGTIAVKEIGFIVKTGIGTLNVQNMLFIRDVLAAPIDILSGKTLTVVYDLSLVMSN